MEGLIELLRKWQQKGKEILSHLLATNNPETLMEEIMKEPEEKVKLDDLPDKKNEYLYTESEKEEYVLTNNREQKEGSIKAEKVDVRFVDRLIQECEDVSLQKVQIKSGNKEDSDKAEALDNENNDNEIINSIIKLFDELDNISVNIEDDNTKNVIVYCQNRMMEILLNSGGEKIEDEKEFDILRHTTRPLTVVANGTTIKETVRSGIIFNGKIIIKAIVKI